MDDTFNQNELSDEDLAVLRAFDALNMEDWEAKNIDKPPRQLTQPLGEQDTTIQPELANLLSPEEMLNLFTTETDEDLTILQRTLQQLEPDDQLDSIHLQTLQRTAHKMKGTTGAIGCTVMSSIAHHIEELVRLIISGKVVPFIGLNALVQTVRALEVTFNSFVTGGQESTTPLTELEAEYKALNIDIHAATFPKFGRNEESMPMRMPFKATEEDYSERESRHLQEQSASPPYVRVDVHRFEQLALHTEQLAELRAPLENAQAEVEKALHELQTTQGRLRYLETLLSTPLIAKISNNKFGYAENDERPTSSLVARILDEASERTGHSYQHKIKLQPGVAARLKLGRSLTWDELELDHFTESDLLIHSFNEAIADVATAASQLRTAFDHLNRVMQTHMNQADNVRNDTLLLRLAPISTLVPRIERVVAMSAIAQQRQVQFEVEGETTEIDQDILEELKHPLLQLVRTCVAYNFAPPLPRPAEQSEDTGDLQLRVWLYVRPTGNEVAIEVGFSMAVNGGALDEVQEAIRRLNGSISVRRNAFGGVSFNLRLPRSQGSVQGLLVRVGSYHVIVPFSQVQHIDDGRQKLPEPPTSLNTLLGFPTDQASPATLQPVLILQPGLTPPAVQVDEVLGEVKLIVKLLSPHLQRRGIAGTAIDGMGNVLLMVDLPELVRYREGQLSSAKTAVARSDRKPHSRQMQPSILVADDSVYIRQSLLQTLSRAGYQVMEAHDGIEAIEILLAHHPDVLVLDIEMPNLNGYDLLSIIRAHPELARVKIVMLTSRSSERHQARAHDLGAHAYLTKPRPRAAPV